MIYLILLALPPLIAGAVLVMLARSGWGRTRPFPRCGGCGYDVTGSIGSTDRCPECGRPFAEVGIRPTTPRFERGRVATTIALVALISFGAMALIGFAATMQARAQAARAEVQAAMAAQAAKAALAQQQAVAAQRADDTTMAGDGPVDDATEPDGDLE